MEKKMASRPPSFMRGMSMLPSVWRTERSNLGSRRRWVVSSWVSMKMEEEWSFLAWSETDWEEERVGVIKSSRRERECTGRIGLLEILVSRVAEELNV